MTSMTFPDGFTSIGANAFTRENGTPNTTLQSITLPSTVTTIGENAFYNYTGLATVTVLSEILKKPGAGAFGTNEYNAYATTTDIELGGDGGLVLEDVSKGADFRTPNEEISQLFISGENCYLGEITPFVRQPENDKKATCDEEGWEAYKFTYGGLEQTFYLYLEQLGHQYVFSEHIPATCERDSYDLWLCTRTEGETHRDERLETETGGSGIAHETALGHNYQPSNIENIAIKGSNSGNTIITYSCANGERHSNQSNYSLSSEIAPTTLTATTADTIDTLKSKISGIVSTQGGKLSLNETEFNKLGIVDDSGNIVYGVHNIPVIYTPGGNTGVPTNRPVSELNGVQLTVEINVSATEFDMKDVAFDYTIRYIGDGTAVPPASVDGHNDNIVSPPTIEYYVDGKWVSDAPADIEENVDKDFRVRAVYEYDNQKYSLNTELTQLQISQGYEISAIDGTIYLSAPYSINQLSLDMIETSATENLVYNGSPQNTVNFSGTPLNTTITYSWVNNEDPDDKGEGEITASSANFNGVQITEAGTYTVTIHAEYLQYDPYDNQLTVTVAPKPLTLVHDAGNNQTYTPGTTFTGVKVVDSENSDVAADGVYSLNNHRAIDADSYTAEAVLTDTRNYKWSSTNETSETLGWVINKRVVLEPTLRYNTSTNTATYNFNPIEGIINPTLGSFNYYYDGDSYFGSFDNGGAIETPEVVFELTNARKTDAGTYEVIAELKEPKNYYWQNHRDEPSFNLGSWRISPFQIILGNLAINTPVAYTGYEFDENNINASAVLSQRDEIPDSQYYDQILGISGYQYYTRNADSASMDYTPKDAGTYWVKPTYTFKGELKAENFSLINDVRQSFTIAQAPISFNGTDKTETYDGNAKQIDDPSYVSGLLGDDTETAYSFTYASYTYTPVGGEPVGPISIENNRTSFINAGKYEVTVNVNSTNYRSDAVICTLTINKTTQGITLSPDEATSGAGHWNSETKTVTKTYGDADFSITGQGEKDAGARISYSTEGTDYITIDSGNGNVTILKPTAAEGITITVAAEATGNVEAANAAYTLIINKADPNVTLADQEIAYTGAPVTGYANASVVGASGKNQPTGEVTYTFYDSQENAESGVETGRIETPTNIGDYYIRADYPGDEYYNPSHAVSKLSITAQRFSPAPTAYSGAYDGETHDPATFTGIPDNAQPTITWIKANGGETETPAADSDRWSSSVAGVKNVSDSGSYFYRIEIDNYETVVGRVDNVSVSPRPLTITSEPVKTKEYDGNNAATVGGVTEAADSGAVTGEITGIDAAAAYADKNAGENKQFTITYTLTTGENFIPGNYSFGGQVLTDATIEAVTNDGVITKKSAEIAGIAAVDRAYNADDSVVLGGTPQSDDIIDGDNVTFTLAEGAEGTMTDANAGDGKTVTAGLDSVVIGGTDANNYSFTIAETSVDIAKADSTLEFGQDSYSVGYTGAPILESEYEKAVLSGVSGDNPTGETTYNFYSDPDCTNQVTENGGIPSAVGVYYVKAEYSGDINYNGDDDTARIDITDSSELRVNITGYTDEYDGAEHEPYASLSVTGLGGIGVIGYDIGYIKKADADEAQPESSDPRWNSETNVKDVSDGGEYWYKVTAVNYQPVVGSVSVSITPKPVEIVHDAVTKQYDGTDAAAVNNISVQTGVAIDSGAIADETINAALGEGAAKYNSPNVTEADSVTATYTLTAGENTNLANYVFKAQGAEDNTAQAAVNNAVTLTENGAITTAPVTVTIYTQTSVYDGNKPDVGDAETENWSTTDAVYSQGGVKDDLGISLDIPNGSINAGSYTISGEYTNTNYTVTFTGGENAYTITRRPVSIQIGDVSGIYGDDPDLRGAALTDISDTSTDPDSGIVQGESAENLGVNLGTNAAAGRPISGDNVSYKIYAVGGDSTEIAEDTSVAYGNYDVEFSNGTYTINQRPITITINDHESDYLQAIDSGVAAPVLNTDYSAAYTGDSEKTAVYAGDRLSVVLSTDAENVPGNQNSNAGTYAISGEASITRDGGDVIGNYAVTYAGETPFGGDGAKATYTINKAGLEIRFTNGDKDPDGIPIAYQPTYQNKLVLTNTSTGEAVAVQSDVAAIKDAASYTSNNESLVTNDGGIIVGDDASATLNITAGTGSVQINVSVAETSNYKASGETWYILRIATGGGGISLQVDPNVLTYTGGEQALVTTSNVSPEGVRVQYRLGEDGEWRDEIPKGTAAGNYRVYYRAELAGYASVENYRDVTIAKADNPARFTNNTKSISYEENLTYYGGDAASGNPLIDVPDDYTKTDDITYSSNMPSVAWAEDFSHTLSIRGTGDAVIAAVLPEDDNYKQTTVTYTLHVTDAGTINYTATDPNVTYDGQPHSLGIDVTGPSEYRILYKDGSGAYTITDTPTFTNAGTYTVEFAINANGYNQTFGSGTVTIAKKEIDAGMFSSSIGAAYTYIGSPIEPPVTVTYNGMALAMGEDADYTVEYGTNTDAGQNAGSVAVKAVEGDNKNYTGEATVYFDINPINANYMTATLNRYHGVYGDENTNNATVTVKFGENALTLGSDYTLSCKEAGAPGHEDCSIDGNTVTFGSVGAHTIIVTGAGNYTNSQTELVFYLLPASSDNGLSLTLNGDPSPKITTYGDEITGEIEVTTDDNAHITSDHYDLTYEYKSNTGSGDIPAGTIFTDMSLLRESGLYVITATAKGSYAGSGTFVVLIQKRDLNDAEVTVTDISDLVYDGSEQKPGVTVSYSGANGAALTDGDYTIDYRNNVNAADKTSQNPPQAIISASESSNNFTGIRQTAFTIRPKSIEDEDEFTIDDIPDQVYTGNPLTPTVTLRENGTALGGGDYKVEYDNNVNDGTANITITGQGNYTGTRTAEFEITRAEGINVVITPNDLEYTGAEQKLFDPEDVTVTPGDAAVSYSLEENGTYTSEIPSGTDADVYRVYYKAELNGYATASGYVDAEIKQADIEGGFAEDTIEYNFASGLSYDGDTLNKLSVSANFKGKIEYISSNPFVASVDDINEHKLTIRNNGTTVITARAYGDANYRDKDFTYTLNIGTAGIVHTSSGYEEVYDGRPHGITLDITAPESGYAVAYNTVDDGAYPLETAPVFTDAGDYDVYYRITADGYRTVTGSEEVSISKKPITADMFSGSVNDSYSYTGSKIEPNVVVAYNGAVLTTDDYEIIYGENTNAGEDAGTITVRAKDTSVNYTGEATVTFDITAYSMNSLAASLDRYFGVYGDEDTNNATATVSFGDVILEAGKDYDVSVTNPSGAVIDGNRIAFSEVGSYSIAITAKGNYSGEINLAYTLLPAASENGFRVTIDGSSRLVTTYGDAIDETINVQTQDGIALTETADYDLTYEYISNDGENDVDAGTAFSMDVLGDAGMYIVTATAKGGYTGAGTFVFLIQKRDMNTVDTSEIADVIYNRSEQKPEVTASYTGSNGAALTDGDYSISYQNNVNAGTAQTILTANADSNNFMGVKTAAFSIQPKSVSGFSVSDIPDQIHTGEAITPRLTVTDPDGDYVLNASEYTAEYTNNIDIGEANVKITGRGNYKDSIDNVTFNIIASSSVFDLTIQNTNWVYDPALNAGDITVTYNGSEIAIGSDYKLSISKNGGEATEYTDLDDARAAMIEPGTYTATAIGINGYASAPTDTKTVTIEKIQPVIDITSTPSSLIGGGKITISVTAQNLPEGTALEELGVTKNGEAMEPLALTETETGYTAELDTPNENATYVFSVSLDESEYHKAASGEAQTVTTERTGNLFELSIGRTGWVYDGKANAESITVRYGGEVLTIGSEFELTIAKDGEAAAKYETVEDAIAAMIEPGTYTVTATGIDSYDSESMSDSKTVTIDKIRPVIDITTMPERLTGGGIITISVSALNLPDGLALTELNVDRNDEDMGTIPLTRTAGGYLAELDTPNENADYVFSISIPESDRYAEAYAESASMVTERTGNLFDLSIGRTEWIYDPDINAESVAVTYGGEAINIIDDYTLTISKDGGEAVVYTSTDEAIAAMSDPGAYTITAVGAGGYESEGMEDSETVTINKITPLIDMTASPSSLIGGGKIVINVSAANLPAESVLTELNVIRNGEALEPLALTRTETGYTAELTAPNENAEYLFSISVQGDEYYNEASAEAAAVVTERTSGAFDLTVENTSWIYDGKANAGSISVTYGGGEIVLNTDYALTVSKDGGEATEYDSLEDAVNSMIEPGVYTVTATGINGYQGASMTDSETVTIDKIQPVIEITANPTSLSGSGDITLTVTVSNMPDDASITELKTTKNGEESEPIALTETDGVYTAVFEAPNQNAEYVFSYVFEGDEHYKAASSEETVVTAQRTSSNTGGGGWSGGGSGGGSWGSGGGSSTATPEPTIRNHDPYIIGYEDGTFMPEGNITRAEAAMMFARILAGDDGIPTDLVTSFVDVQDGEWYYDAVTYLQSYNILEGRGENRFEPDDNITRAEFVTICTRFDAYTAVDTINEFSDVTANHWAYAYINYAVHEKWITGYEDGSFRPDNNITRAEAVRVVNNVIDRSADEEYVDENAVDMDIFPDVTTAHWAYYDIIEAAIAHDFIASDSAEEWQKTAKADQSDAADE